MRVRYDQNGFDGFLDYEILEFILFYSIPRKDTREEAKSLLKEFGSLSGVFGADFYTLQKCKGIGAASARLLKLFPDIARICAAEKLKNKTRLTTSTDAGEYAVALLAGRLYECFYVVSMDASKTVLFADKIAEGGISEVRVNIRKVVESVMKHNAQSVLLVHNHPGATLHPSEEDVEITHTIIHLLESIEIPVIDHIIVAGERFTSMTDRGFI